MACSGIYAGTRSILFDARRGLALEFTNRCHTYDLVGPRTLLGAIFGISKVIYDQKKTPKKTCKNLKLRLNTNTCEDPDAI